MFVFPFLFLFAVLCQLFFNVLEVHIYMCLNRLDSPVNLAPRSTVVMSILIYIFLIMYCWSYFVFHYFAHSLFCFHFYLFLHWRNTTKVMVTLSVLSNCFTFHSNCDALSLPFLIFFCLIMAGNTAEQYRAAIGLFYRTVRSAKFSFFCLYLFQHTTRISKTLWKNCFSFDNTL